MSLKILFLSHKFYPDIGGIEVNSEILANAFTEAGHRVCLITWSADATDRRFPFTVLRNPTKLQLFRYYTWADAVFENNPSLRLDWPGLFINRPSIVALNTWVSRVDGKIGLQDKLKLNRLKKATKVIAVSDALRKSCWPEADVIRNPYRASDFKINPRIGRTKSFVFLGRLVSDKGADIAIKAMQQLAAKSNKKAIQDFSLTIIGDGPERKNLETLAAEVCLTDRIKFVGFLQGQALVNCLNQHRFLLVPSVWEEPFGNVVLEGMACGCLPIVSDGGGLPEAIGQAGLTFKRNSVEALVACIQSVLENQLLEKQLKQAATVHLARHQPALIANEYLNSIQSAIQSSK